LGSGSCIYNVIDVKTEVLRNRELKSDFKSDFKSEQWTQFK